MLRSKNKFSKGFTLVEVLIAIALLSILGVGLLSALTGASTVLLHADTNETARDLAEAQMEYLQSLTFGDFYTLNTTLDAEHPGFTSSITSITPIEAGHLQQITISVKQGTEEKFSLTGRKVNW